jgi:hypothetical protein
MPKISKTKTTCGSVLIDIRQGRLYRKGLFVSRHVRLTDVWVESSKELLNQMEEFCVKDIDRAESGGAFLASLNLETSLDLGFCMFAGFKKVHIYKSRFIASDDFMHIISARETAGGKFRIFRRKAVGSFCNEWGWSF